MGATQQKGMPPLPGEDNTSDKPVVPLPAPGVYLRQKREALGVSLDQILKELREAGYPVERSRLFRIEQGTRPMPDELPVHYIKALKAIVTRYAEALGMRFREDKSKGD